MEYNLVSGDSHVDMSWLPGDLFLQNAPSSLKEKMPNVTETEEGARWVVGDQVLGVAGGAGFSFLPTLKNKFRRMDRMIEMGFLQGMDEGRYHPTDPDLRAKDMALDGVEAEVLYGMTSAGIRIKDPEIVAATFGIYNDWAADFCQTRPGRWYALACVPVHDPTIAAEELRRVAKLGLRGSDLYVGGIMRPIYVRDGYWDPLWEAAAETQMPISFHIGGGGGLQVKPPQDDDDFSSAYLSDAPSQNQLAFQGTSAPLGQLAGSEWLVSIIMSGACQRYPDFQFVLGECGAGWVPFVIERMDIKYKDGMLDEKFDPPLELNPSEYWYRQGATTFQQDPCVGHMADYIGVDNLIWGSDYPHPDGVWPDSKKVIQETMGQLDAQTLKKITCDNAVKLYRMGK
jgi:predicted TIM-barrel fold metal-dependent hydrolase